MRGLWIAVRVAEQPRARRAILVLGLAAVVVGVLGVGVHVWANLEAAPLDADYETTWATLPVVEQWWLATTGGVGPAPTLAPVVLIEIGLALLLASIRLRTRP